MIQFRNPETGLLETFKGLKGEDGKSAYKYATEMGYPGSEQDFALKMGFDIEGALGRLEGELAGKGSHLEVTQAEYDALGNEKLTNGVTYFIKDSNSEIEDTPEIDDTPTVVEFPSEVYSPTKNYKATMQDDGNFVIYDSTNQAIFNTAGINNQLGGLSLYSCTQTEYDNLPSHDSNTLYFIKG